MNSKIKARDKEEIKFVEGIDFVMENGFMILTAHFLRKRGYCCGNGCRNCPYSNDEKTVLEQEGF